MIGILRPVKSQISTELKNKVNTVHCSGCVAVKDVGVRPLSLFYIYEADFLLYLFLGFNKLNYGNKNVFCTGFPIVKKPILILSEYEKQVLFYFSVIAAYSFLDDKIRDDNNLKAKYFIKLYEKYFTPAYLFLNDENRHIYNPKELNKINEKAAKTIEDLANLYKPLTANLYFNALKKLGIKISDNLLNEICNYISDILIFTDSIADYYEDKAENNFNPIANEEELELTFEKLKNIISKLSILISVTVNPWKSIMQNILSYGIINYINKRREKYDKR
ncbi:MAG TPA: DUF5685 family protein [Melioribacteraceae bacterium]|nr:DUF5685 family protein [Melioribacteraceae bacterium]